MGVSIQILDADGDDVTSLFAISGPALAGLTAVDGTGSIPAETLGSAGWTIVPTHDAAGSTPINYFVSGMLRYVDNGLPV